MKWSIFVEVLQLCINPVEAIVHEYLILKLKKNEYLANSLIANESLCWKLV